MLNLITDHIDIWTSAIASKSSAGRGSSNKTELYGIKKLRELILELAVRGKLVPQDPTDEPASVLLEKIATEKAELIKQGKIKKQKTLPEISEDEKPFELPEGWEWCYLQDISLYIQRGKGPKYDESGSVKVISQKCIQWSGFTLEPAKYVNDDSLSSYQDERFVRPRDLLWNSTGTGTVGRINLIDYVEERSLVVDSHVTLIRVLSVDANFVKDYIAAPNIQSRIEPDHESSLVSGSTKQVELNTSAVVSLVLPIPPLAEQHRIVAKVDELMALCDELEAQTNNQQGAHQTLVETLLTSLTKAQNAHELADNWQLLSQHFDCLFTTEASIDLLKQTILQLAVMGKLVPQNPNDEPASVLLEKIVAEKVELIKQGKIKKQKPLPEISDEEKQFELPEGWEWCKFGSLALFINGDRGKNYPNKDEYVDIGIPWINTGHIESNGTLTTRDMNFISPDKYESLRSGKILEDDLVYCLRGATFGKTAFVRPYKKGAIASSLMIVRVYLKDLNSFVYNYLISPFGRSQIYRFDNGSAQPNLSANSVGLYAFPLPPLAEQHRIVAKVDELMAICDALKANLANAQTTQLNLTDALVEQALN